MKTTLQIANVFAAHVIIVLYATASAYLAFSDIAAATVGTGRAGREKTVLTTRRITLLSKHTHTSDKPTRLQTNRVFTRSSKRPANFQQMYSKYT